MHGPAPGLGLCDAEPSPEVAGEPPFSVLTICEAKAPQVKAIPRLKEGLLCCSCQCAEGHVRDEVGTTRTSHF